MKKLSEKIRDYVEQFHQLMTEGENKRNQLPGNTFFLEDGSILSLPRNDGDNRFPYGKNGYNYWAYASGYMHANDGLFSTFLRAGEGQEPKIAFFAGVQDRAECRVLSLLSVPALDDRWFGKVNRFTVFTNEAVYYVTEAMQMLFGIRIFVDDTNGMHYSVSIENLCEQDKEIYVAAYFNPSLSNSIYESSEDRWFRKCEMEKEDDARIGHFVFSMNEDISRTESITNFGVLNQVMSVDGKAKLQQTSATTSRREFVGGTCYSLNNAIALRRGYCDPVKWATGFSDVAIAAQILQLEIMHSGICRWDLEFNYHKGAHDSEAYKELLHAIDPMEVDQLEQDAVYRQKAEDNTLSIQFGDNTKQKYNCEIMNYFMKTLRKQIEFCSLIKGYVQLSPNSLIGIRDVYQALEGYQYSNPSQTRNKILESMNFIFPDGRCPRQYGLPHHEMAFPPMDLRQFIDQGCWVISMVVSYIKFTGDEGILQEICGYHEILDETKRLVQKSTLRDSVLMHLLRIMNYLIDNQDDETGCIKVLYGDWNDALDGLGVSQNREQEFGNGVSVMATLQVYQNLSEMTALLQYLKPESKNVIDILDRYQRCSLAIETGIEKYAIVKQMNEKRIVHGWGEHQSYYVGSFQDPDGRSRVGLTSNAFYVISGMYQTNLQMHDTIVNTYDQLDSPYGLKTFKPGFTSDAKGVGRIYKLPEGTAENGAVYIHATAFAVQSLFMMGEPIKAWEQLWKILPFTHEHISCSPYVMPNSYGKNVEIGVDGESMQDWQTGSSNVVFKTILRYVIGFLPEFGGVTIQPATGCPFEHFSFMVQYQGKTISIFYENHHTGTRKFSVNNELVEADWDEIMKIKKLYISASQLLSETIIWIQD